MIIDKIAQDRLDLGSEIQIEQEKHHRIFVDGKLRVHNNHIVFEINLEKRTIHIADFSEIDNTINYHDCLKGKHKQYNILKKQGCIYSSALNVENLVRRLKRDNGIDVSSFKYLKEESNAGTIGTIELLKSE